MMHCCFLQMSWTIHLHFPRGRVQKPRNQFLEPFADGASDSATRSCAVGSGSSATRSTPRVGGGSLQLPRTPL